MHVIDYSLTKQTDLEERKEDLLSLSWSRKEFSRALNVQDKKLL